MQVVHHQLMPRWAQGQLRGYRLAETLVWLAVAIPAIWWLNVAVNSINFTSICSAPPLPPLPSPSPPRAPFAQLLTYCGEHGRFSNQVIALFKMLWLAASLDRTLVLPHDLQGEPTLSVFDRTAIESYFSAQGRGAVMLPQDTPCLHTDTLYTMSMVNGPLYFELDWWQANNCLGNCRFAGKITALWAFDHPRVCCGPANNTIAAVTANAPPPAEVDLARIPVLAMPQTAAFLMSVPDEELPVLPLAADVEASARAVLAALRPLDSTTEEMVEVVVSMCVHVRREDLAKWQPTLEAVVAEVRAKVAQWGVTRLFIATNADATEREYLAAHLPGGTEVGCDPAKWPHRCESGSVRQAVTEQAVCSLTDFFVGSPFSSFTGVITAQRERVQRKHPATGGLLAYDGSPPVWRK